MKTPEQIDKEDRDTWLNLNRGLTSDWRRWVLAFSTSIASIILVVMLCPKPEPGGVRWLFYFLGLLVMGYGMGRITKPLTRCSDAEQLAKRDKFNREMREFRDKANAIAVKHGGESLFDENQYPQPRASCESEEKDIEISEFASLFERACFDKEAFLSEQYPCGDAEQCVEPASGNYRHHETHSACRRDMVFVDFFGWVCPKHIPDNAEILMFGKDVKSWGR